jgi:predicted small lipoprotein YifL
MAKPLATLLIGLSLCAFPACGRKGPLELPPGRAPKAVEGLSAAAREGSVVLAWTNPAGTVGGHPLGALREAEVWVFERDLPAAGAALEAGAVERSARLAGHVAVAPGAASSYVFEVRPGGPPRLAFAVRVLDGRGRASAFSPPAAVTVARDQGDAP